MDAKLETPIYITLRKMNGLPFEIIVLLVLVYAAKLQPPYKLANWGNWTVTLKNYLFLYISS